MATQPTTLPPDEDEGEIVSEGSTLSAIEEADRSHQVATALKYPRSFKKFVEELKELSCLSQPVAQEMVYSIPRAGKQLVGPSIRFAEAILSCWGNARAGVEVVDIDRSGDSTVVVSEGRFYDCEKNVGLAIRVRRRVVAKKVDADAIQVTGAAGSSIALRGAILRGVPKALWQPVFEQAKATAVGEVKSLDEVRTRFMNTFKAMGVTEDRLFKALGVPGAADIGTEEILAMQAWQKQLKDQESTIEDIFGSPLDGEIQELMDALNWTPTQQRMSRTNFKGERGKHLDYLRAEAKKANIAATDSQPQQKAATTPTPEAKPQEVAQEQEKPSNPDTTAGVEETAPTTTATTRKPRGNW